METNSNPPLERPKPSRNSLLWLIMARFAFSFLGITYILFYVGQIETGTPHYITLFAACSVNLIYFIWLRTGKYYLHLAVLQVVVDLLLESIVLYLTGGVFFSIFSFLFFATVIYAPLITVTGGGLVSGSLATILISAVSIVYVLSDSIGFSLPYVPKIYTDRYSETLGTVIPYMISFGISLHLVGYLSDRLVRRMGVSQFLTRKILDSMAEGVAAVEENGQIHLLNEVARRYLNIQEEESTSPLRLKDLTPSETWEKIGEQLRNDRGGKWEIELETEDEESRYLEISASPEPIPGPGYLDSDHFYFLFIRDVTARVRAEQERTRAEKMETISNLGASIAHEIKNPLSSIRGAIQEMKGTEDVENPENEHRLVDIVLRESDRVNRIINDFLDFSKERTLDKTSIRLKDLTQEVVEMVGKQKDDSNYRLNLEIPEELTVEADRDRLKQVFYNLILNAIEHPENPGTVKITAQTSPMQSFREDLEGVQKSTVQEGVRVDILDEGPGIPEDELSRVFDPFYSTRKNGTGLGLAITAQIIRSHNGTIRAENRVQEGSRFWFWIPR